MIASGSEAWITAADGARLRTLAWRARRPHGRVLVVHGFGEHGARYEEPAGRLAGAGWSVLAFDLRGHGASDGRRGVLESFALLLSDLAAARDALDERVPGPGAPVLLGHSLGALVTLRYLMGIPEPVEPVRALVLSAPWLATAVPVPAWKRGLSRVLDRVAPELTLSSGMDAEQLTRDAERARAWREDPLVHDRISGRLWHEVRRTQDLVLAAGPPVDTPALVLVPTADEVADPGVTEAWVASAGERSPDVHRVPGGRHEPFHDVDRAEVLHVVVAWLAGLVAAQEPDPDGRVSPPNVRAPSPRSGPEASNLHRDISRNR